VIDPDMREHFVIDPLISKRQQLLLATQLCRMVLKVCTHFSLSLQKTSVLSLSLPAKQEMGGPEYLVSRTSLSLFF
jgi:hypothetical protein